MDGIDRNAGRHGRNTQLGPAAKQAVEPLKKFLELKGGPIPFDTVRAALALYRIESSEEWPDIRRFLHSGLKSQNPNIRLYLIHGLQQGGAASKGLLPDLRGLFSDKERNIQVAAARAVIVIDGASAHKDELAVIIANLDCKSGCCVIATRALGELGVIASESVPALVRELDSDDYSVRIEAARALEKIGTPAAVAAVERYWDGVPGLK